jgi:hypothetical protein
MINDFLGIQSMSHTHVYLPAVAPPLAFAGLGDVVKVMKAGSVPPAVTIPNVANVWSTTTRRDTSIGAAPPAFLFWIVVVDAG